jgi:hypothetical protein
MNYFKKVGTRSEEEQGMLQAIEIIIESKQIPRNEIPDALNLDDLIEIKHLVDAYEGDSRHSEIEDAKEVEDYEEPKTLEEENITEIEDGESMEAEAEPFIEEIEGIEENNEQKRTENTLDSIEQVEPEIDISEIIENEELDFITENYNPFEEPIIERSYNKGNDTQDQQDHDNLKESDEFTELDESKEPTPLDDASDRTRQKAAEQTADTILKGYSRLAPKPFKWLAKVSESKAEKLAFSGQLDLDLEVSEGVTFDDYMKSTNEQVDEIFEVDEDTLEEIREPLIEVLKEQSMELTPQQRLGMAVISHLMQMFTIAMKLRNQNNRILSYQKQLTKLSRTKVA